MASEVGISDTIYVIPLARRHEKKATGWAGKENFVYPMCTSWGA